MCQNSWMVSPMHLKIPLAKGNLLAMLYLREKCKTLICTSHKVQIIVWGKDLSGDRQITCSQLRYNRVSNQEMDSKNTSIA